MPQKASGRGWSLGVQEALLPEALGLKSWEGLMMAPTLEATSV